ncbi:hypothetical protein T4C_7306 [Trichinella pseudospiralis]|uniref:Uncharacterized protein n=1 Tax=Trichinella pseudospiralis TaxID=6337 RepID=A0A0V1JU13_TRIPS|nr:hypothetical protein T4C_7306 [Trichinella pseudospiralis]
MTTLSLGGICVEWACFQVAFFTAYGTLFRRRLYTLCGIETFAFYKAIHRVEDFLASKATTSQNSSDNSQSTNHWSVVIHASKSLATGSGNAATFGPT